MENLMVTDSTQTLEHSQPSWISEITREQMQHPDAIVARLRDEAPLAWVPASGTYLATSWELCHEIATDAENFESLALPWHGRVFGEPAIINSEGEVHERLRQALGTPVSARAIRGQVESRIRPTAKELVEKLRGQGRTELMVNYFEPISVRCVADSYGFFDVPTDTLRRWFHSLKSGAINTATNEDGSFANPAGFDAAVETREEIRAYLERKSHDDPEQPDSVIARWLNQETDDGTPWTIDYVLPSMLVVLLGGLQEPGHAMGNTFLGLTTAPDQLQRTIADKALIPRAVAEGLRWIAPLFAGPTRSPKRDMTFHGVPLKKGALIHLVYGSANRDRSEFPDGASFNIDRASHPNLAFGEGRHSCLGSAIAPQIARVALEELFSAFPHIALDPEQSAAAVGWPFNGPPQLHVILGDPTL
jgi:aromatic O-demethylase, cytochrome P450 subunit